MSTTIIAASTLATTSGTAGVLTLGGVSAMPCRGENLQNQFAAFGLAGAETVEVYVAGVDRWVAVSKDSVPFELTATDNTVTLQGPALFGFIKSVTEDPAGLDYCNLR